MAIFGAIQRAMHGENFWDAYYDEGIIPNIWKGITGQTSNDRNADKALAESKAQYESELEWQREKYDNDMDFANRQLDWQMQTAEKNFNLEKEAFQYQKDLNETQMAREDSAVQRQIADYSKAGFSPLAAIGGNGAGSVALSSGSAPHIDTSGVASASGHYLDLARQYASLHGQLSSKYNEQRQGARFALMQMNNDSKYKGLNMAEQYFNAAVNYRQKKLENEYMQQNIETKKYENDYYEEHGYRQVTLATVLSDFLQNNKVSVAIDSITDSITDGLDNLSNRIDEISNMSLEEYAEKTKQTVTEGTKKNYNAVKRSVTAVFDNNKQHLSSVGKKMLNAGNEKIYNKLKDDEKTFAQSWARSHNKKVLDFNPKDWYNMSKDYKAYGRR